MLNRKNDFTQVLAVINTALMVLFALGPVIYYILFPAPGFFHSDSADTILWAKAAADSGRIFDPAFQYAALLPFGANLWLTPLTAFFGMNMGTHTAGMLIFALVFAGAALFLGRSLGWSWRWSIVLMAAILLFLSGSDKLREIMWGHVIYYSLGILFVMLGLGMLLRSLFAKDISKQRFWLLMLGLFSAGAATDGFQGVALFFVPLAGAVIMERFCDPDARINNPESRMAAIRIAVMAAGTAAGLILLFTVFRRGGVVAAYADGYSEFSETSTWQGNWQRIGPNLISLFGLNIPNGISIVSLEAFIILSRLLSLLLIVIIPVILMIHYRQLDDRGVRILLWVHTITTFIILFLVIFGKLGGANWRLVPALGTGILCTVAACQRRWKQIVSARFSLFASLILLMGLTMNAAELLSMEPDYGRDNDLYQLSRILQEEELTYGYATFWQSQALTVITGEKSRVRSIALDELGVRPRHYQSRADWFQDQPQVDSYFMILDEEELKLLENGPDGAALAGIEIERVESPTGHIILVYEMNPWHVTEHGFDLD